MAMIQCGECSKPISSEATACPQCGAPVRKPAEGPGILGSLGIFVGGLAVVFVVWAMIAGANDPEGDEKSKARGAIKLCWEDQARKSNDPGTARFIAGACEMMERDYETKYKSKP